MSPPLSSPPLIPVDPMGEVEPAGVLELEVLTSPPVPLRFLPRGGRYYLLTSGAGAAWASLAVRAGTVRVRIPPSAATETRWVRRVTDPAEASSVRAEFARAVGAPEFDRWFPAADRVLSLETEAPAHPPGHLERVVEEFDASVERYESAFANSPFERYLKRRSLERLLPLFAGADPLLEVGAGVGLETLPLLAAGHRITAVDVSERMLARLEARAREAGLAAALRTRRGRLASLGAELGDVPPGSFRGAYSTYGAFDLEPDLAGVGAALGRLLGPGAPLFVAVLNRFGIAPLGYEFLLGGTGPVRARLRRPVPAGAVRYPLDIYPRSPGELTRLLAPEFDRVGLTTPSALLPPFESPRRLSALGPRSVDRLHRFDVRLARSPLGVALGEWVFLTFRRRGDAAPARRDL